MNDQTITIKDAIELALNKLNGVSVTVSQWAQVGQPIKEACDILDAVAQTIRQAEANEKKKQEDEQRKMEEI